ncbi:MAG: flagellar biosynthesis protein FlhB [Defluviitaleaceae bacterium]|nr:flagellar biosynthesis protein FlhB [Defluviitaleaceae bacterium]
MDEKNLKLYIPLNLSYFADGGGEKTETATRKKREKAREEGQVLQSQEIGTSVLLIIGFFSLSIFGIGVVDGLREAFAFNFEHLTLDGLEAVTNMNYITGVIAHMFIQIVLISLPIMLMCMVAGLITNLAQVGLKFTSKPLKPNLGRLNPIKGFKKIFSMRAIVELAKSMIKLVLVGSIVYLELSRELENISAVMFMPLLFSFGYMAQISVRLGMIIGAWFIIVAILDYSYQKYKHEKDLKMSKHEVKEEYKQMDGNPLIKSKIRSKMREASMQRMMQSVPGADVIITNPTHFAVAVSYNREAAQPPKVVAKGVDHLAKRIKEIGKDTGVTIVENKEVARALYAAVDVGAEIPSELYKSVAEILAYVYKLKNIV